MPENLKRVASADKANVLYTSQFWRNRFDAISREYPDLSKALESVYIDAQHALLIRRPKEYDVIVTDNLFGDILTDLATELTGSLGLGGSGNINPEGVSMFEPIHGSAPDIAGKGIANPIGMIFAAKLMLETLGHYEEANLMENAVVKALRDGYRTTDIAAGVKPCSTEQMGDAIAENIRKSR